MTYLTRRYAGVFYARIRVTTSSGRRTLLRFSLGTRDRLEARRHLLAYLSWLLPMQTAVDPGQLFDDILTHGRAMVLKGPARTRAEVAHRIRFVDLAWTHRADWIASDPCPIRDHHAYEVQEEVRWTLMMLNEMLKEDMPRLEMKRDDVDSGWMRDEAIEALCFDAATGRVRAYLPDEFRDMYDADPDVEFGVREGEVSIYDMYLEADGRKRKVHVAPPPARPTSAGDRSRSATPSVRTAAKDEAGVTPASASTLLSAAKRDFLAARRIAKGDGRAEEDAGLIIDFMIDFIGDKPIADITPDDLHAFEIAMASTPDRLRIPKDHAVSWSTRHTPSNPLRREGVACPIAFFAASPRGGVE